MTPKREDDASIKTGATFSSEELIKPYMIVKKMSDKLDSLGVEVTGIDRIPGNKRAQNKTKQLIHVIGLWISASGGLSSMSSFYLGPLLFGLGLKKTLILGLTGQIFGCLIAAYCSLMGPRSGCRQMVSGRFLFGWWFIKLVCLASIIGVMGWSVVNCIVGGQILSAISNGKVPLIAAIIIIAVVSLCISIAGIRFLVRVEAYLSIPVTIAFLTLYIAAAPKYKYLSSADSPDLSSHQIIGNSLSFFALCYSITSTWGSIAADYYILFPEDTSDIQIFTLTFLGIAIPTTFVGMVAILIGNVAMNYPPWAAAYEELGMGGLLHAAFESWGGGGKFLLILIFLSLISNNILNTYSAVFGTQLIGRPLARIPRWLWSFLLTAIYLVLAIVGRYKFATILGNFLPMVGYWISMYFIILLEENTIFRSSRFRHLYTKEFEGVTEENRHLCGGSENYNFRIWNNQGRLSRGLAATAAFLCGAAGAVVGMAQTYYEGPLAVKVGGDIAMWLCIGFSGLVFPCLRYWELKKFGR
ncbi:hypothetical protein PUMCH_000307 [Australozyma saopauloensis]|uniref:Vitamin B6 transporter n=1 Tax=Australozyma saopauloensis TaxID=291208 RepID=A0AAX4H3K5_9ASCO|nr:hypothetical protein PUMCH_000307 [[Candida] saopauloensis]